MSQQFAEDRVERIEARNKGELGVFWVNVTHPSVAEAVPLNGSGFRVRCPGSDWTITPRITPSIEAKIIEAVRADGADHNRMAVIPFILESGQHDIYHLLEDECDMGGPHTVVRPPYQRDEGDWPGRYFCRKCGRYLTYVPKWRRLFLQEDLARRLYPSFLRHETHCGDDPFPDTMVLSQRHPNVGNDMAILLCAGYAKLMGEDHAGNPVFSFVPFRH